MIICQLVVWSVWLAYAVLGWLLLQALGGAILLGIERVWRAMVGDNAPPP